MEYYLFDQQISSCKDRFDNEIGIYESEVLSHFGPRTLWKTRTYQGIFNCLVGWFIFLPLRN